MSRYCPVCFGEFKDAVKTCPKDNVELTDKKPSEVDRLVDIYAASNEIEAERIVAFLRDAQIDAVLLRAGISQLPMANESFTIAVKKLDITEAKNLITEAREDNVISQNGRLL